MNTKHHGAIIAICAIIALWLLHLSLGVSTGIVLLIAVLGVVAIRAKEDSPLKQYAGAWSKGLAAGAVGILTLVIANAILDIPVPSIATWIWQKKDSAGINSMSLLAILEVMLAVIAGYIGYATLYGQGKARRNLAIAVIAMTVVTLWQVKAPTTPAGRLITAQLQVWTQSLDEVAKAKEADVKADFQELSRDANIYVFEGGTLKKTGVVLEKGQTVLLLREVRSSSIGLQYRKAVAPRNGDFERGAEVWIDARAFTQDADSST